MIILVEK